MLAFREALPVAVVVLTLTVLALTRARKVAWRNAALTLAGGFAALQGWALVLHAQHQIQAPPLWDFKVFWMIAQVAASGHNVYDPASYQGYRQLLNPAMDADFNTIAVNIGMPYPPPAILLLYPLGHFGAVSPAFAAWYGVLFVALGAAVVILWRRFFRAEGIGGLAVAAVLVTALSSTALTVGLGQLDFFAFVLVVLFWDERRDWAAGLLLAPLVVLRPLCLLFALAFLVQRKWIALAALAGETALLFGLSIPLTGTAAIASYLHQNPAARYPEAYFVGSQSLYKMLVKLSAHPQGYFSLVRHPIFDVIALAGVAFAAFVCATALPKNRDAALGFLLALALFLYPNTDTHYCGLLLVPLCALWRDRERLQIPAGVLIAVFGLNYALLDIRGGASTTGLLLAMDCVIFAAIALRSTMAPRSAPDRMLPIRLGVSV